MVEMTETAAILRHATARSLVVLDELGRGTSTYDGMAIAWAVIEYLAGRQDAPRTLFATHYHELTALPDSVPGVRNAHMAVAEEGGGIAFLHRIAPGPADRSYGIHVAALAGLPGPVIDRGWQLLAELERGGGTPLQPAVGRPPVGGQLALFAPAPVDHPAVRALAELEPDRLTPLEALRKLYELVALARE
jgi:DNA mismatch repair protein MutS